MLHLDDEAHVLVSCPEHGAAREEFVSKLSLDTCMRLAQTQSDQDKLMVLLGSACEQDWSLLGHFVYRVRQHRRLSRKLFEKLEQRLQANSFEQKRVEWRRKGRLVCRHGVFFNRPSLRRCPCMSTETMDNLEWSDARLMPAMDHALKCLVTVPFDLHTFSRLG